MRPRMSRDTFGGLPFSFSAGFGAAVGIVAIPVFLGVGSAAVAGTVLEPLIDPEVTPPDAIEPEKRPLSISRIGQNAQANLWFVLPPAMSVEGLTPAGTITADGPLIGAKLGASFAWNIEGITTDPFFFEWNSALGFALGNQSYSTALDGSGSFFAVGAPPVGSIVINTSADAVSADSNVTATVTDSTGDVGNIVSVASSPPGAMVTSASVTPTNTGGVYVGLATDGTGMTAAGYGAIYDGGGFAFVAAGDIGNSRLETTLSESYLSIEQEFLFGRQIDLDSDWIVSVKAGPTYRFTDRSLSRTEVFDLDETVFGATLPEIGLNSADAIRTHAAGLLGGINLSHKITDDWTAIFGFGAGVNVYNAVHSYRSNVLGLSTAHVPTRTGSQSMWGLGTQLRGSVGLSRQVASGGILSFSLFGERRSGVPTLKVTGVAAPAVTFGGGGDNANYNGTDSGYRDVDLTTGVEWSGGIGISYTIRF